MQRDLQITPRRLEYTREKEGELFSSLMAIANRKQEEMKEMIVETLGSMKEQLLEDAANLEFTGQRSKHFLQHSGANYITLRCPNRTKLQHFKGFESLLIYILMFSLLFQFSFF